MKKFNLITDIKQLRTKAQTVNKFDKSLKEIVEKMKKIMVENGGVGLSANQIGVNMAIFIAKPKEKFYVFINPEIELLGNEELKEEGCLSIPGKWGIVKRNNKIKIKYQDLNGKKRKMTARGLLAHIIQHEVDHLNGVLFTDKALEVYEIKKE